MFSATKRSFTAYQVVDLEELATFVFQKDTAYWEHQLEIDPEKETHQGYQVYWVWDLKTHFLAEAARANVFNSDVFVWIDTGCLRIGKYTGMDLVYVDPPPAMTELPGIYIGLVNEFSDVQRTLDANEKALAVFTHEMNGYIAGASFGGTKESIMRWEKAFMEVFSDYVDRGVFTGKDQNLYATLCIERPSLCRFIRPNWVLNDVWFGLVPYVLGEMPDAVPYTLHPLYHQPLTPAKLECPNVINRDNSNKCKCTCPSSESFGV
jgi:hypothetical protein